MDNIIKKKNKFLIYEKHDEVIYILVNGQVMVVDVDIVDIKGDFIEVEYMIDEKGNYIFYSSELEDI